jgi:hypothetical protein
LASGASAGAGISSQFLNVNTSSTSNGAKNEVTAKNITSRNTGRVTSNVDLGSTGATSTTITGGIGNSIVSSAIGASSLASITQTASFGGTAQSMSLAALPKNTVSITGDITATNAHGAPVTANFTINGNNNSVTRISGGVANSITAQAIGAMAGATISQHINNVRN